MRSNLQYQAAFEIRCMGQGNECVGGPCFAPRAMEMFDEENMEGFPREVVLAWLRHD